MKLYSRDAGGSTEGTTATPVSVDLNVDAMTGFHGEVLNVLRWATPAGDARQSIPPAKMQVASPFLGERPPVVTRAEYKTSGFTGVHIDPARFCGYRTLATLEAEVERYLRRSEPFVYAYYDGLDKVAHEYGLGEHYDAELSWLDVLVDRLLSRLPRGAALVVTADHGQVEVLDPPIALSADVLSNCSMQSGEGRFRWLHARAGRGRDLFDAAVAHHADDAWVVTRDEMVEAGWFGPMVTEASKARLGDVALVARRDVAFHDPLDTGPYSLVGRHGSVTRAEMLVPLLVAGR